MSTPLSHLRLDVTLSDLTVERIEFSLAAQTVIAHHYLHRRPPISHAFGLMHGERLVGVLTFGSPASRHLQISASRNNPNLVMELNRLWLLDGLPKNTASWFVARAMKELPARIVVSYADTAHGHDGTVYRAMSWNYAGWTDMDQKKPRVDYIPLNGGHSRDAQRRGPCIRVPRAPKHRYWTTTGTPAERRFLAQTCTWPTLDWDSTPGKPMPNVEPAAMPLATTA